MNRVRAPLAIFMILSLVFLGGCIKRNLYISSDPPGAAVYWNDEEIGTTPLDYDFMWYAVHRIALKKEGYEPIEELIAIKAPIYFWMPFDLIVQLIPYAFWDRRELSYELVPQKE